MCRVSGCFCRFRKFWCVRLVWARACVVCVCARALQGCAPTSSIFYSYPLLPGALALSVVLAEQEGENLSGLSNNPDKGIFAVRENGTTCLMVEFAVKFLVPYDVLALNGIDVRNPRVLEEHVLYTDVNATSDSLCS